MFPSVTLERDKACLLSGAEAESVGLIVVWIIHLCAVCVRWLVSGPGLYCINKTILLQIKTTFIMEMSHKTHQPWFFHRNTIGNRETGVENASFKEVAILSAYPFLPLVFWWYNLPFQLWKCLKVFYEQHLHENMEGVSVGWEFYQNWLQTIFRRSKGRLKYLSKLYVIAIYESHKMVI